jgi:glucose-1-phosphate cytidylyltransferase
VTFDTTKHTVDYHNNGAEKWKITLVETGEDTMTAGRLRKVKDYLLDDEHFCLTYGDGVTDLPIQDVIKFHKKENAVVTLTAVQPPGRFGVFTMEENQTKLTSFHEKPKGDGAWINGGFFVVSSKIFDYPLPDDTMWEEGPLNQLASEGNLAAYRYSGFWQNMDTLRDKQKLESLWASGNAPWKIWE